MCIRDRHLIDSFVRQATVSEMVRWLYDLYERTRDTVAIQFFMEANFMQDVILDEFAVEGELRGYQLPIMPDKRKKPDKIQRIEAVSPLWERGFVWYNERKKEDPDMQVGIEQTLALELSLIHIWLHSSAAPMLSCSSPSGAHSTRTGVADCRKWHTDVYKRQG